MRRVKLGFPQTAVLVFFPAPATARVVSSKLHAHHPVTIIARYLQGTFKNDVDFSSPLFDDPVQSRSQSLNPQAQKITLQNRSIE